MRHLGMWESGIHIRTGPNEFSATDYEEFANKVEEMIADDTTKPILEMLVAPAGMSCAVLTLS